jgi:Uma2 family endonuclease
MSTAPLNFETFEGFSPYATPGPYRAADYWAIEDDKPCELILGRLVVSPSPSLLHQAVSILLSELFLKASRNGGGLAVAAPMDVILADDTIVQPDLLYVAKQNRGIVSERIAGAPDLVVEILSPGTERRDRLEKMDLYAKFGISEFWLVDPHAQLFEFLLNEQGRFVVSASIDDVYHSTRCPEIEIDLRQFWQEVGQRLA